MEDSIHAHRPFHRGGRVVDARTAISAPATKHMQSIIVSWESTPSQRVYSQRPVQRFRLHGRCSMSARLRINKAVARKKNPATASWARDGRHLGSALHRAQCSDSGMALPSTTPSARAFACAREKAFAAAAWACAWTLALTQRSRRCSRPH